MQLSRKSERQALSSILCLVGNLFYLGSGAPPATVWTSETTDSRALSPDATNQGTRKAACYYTEGTRGIRNSMAFTVRCKETRPYQIALYFVDWDRAGRSLGVSMHDADTLDLIASQKVVEDFAGGKYLIYSYNKSATFRIEQVRGDNAVLSGIFFDPAPSNSAPVLNEIGDKSIYGGQIKRFSPVADDAQGSYQTLTYSLIDGPPGAEIDPSSGKITWATAPGTSGSYQFTVRA